MGEGMGASSPSPDPIVIGGSRSEEDEDESHSLTNSRSSERAGDHSFNSINRTSDYTRSEESLGFIEDEEGKLSEQLLVMLEEGQYFGAHTVLDDMAKAPVSTYAAKNLHLLVVD